MENIQGAGAFVIVCDHASNVIPDDYAFLGLASKDRDTHIAWDPGALAVSRRLARMLDAPLVYSTISRLVIDCNRPLDAPDLIVETSETTRVPGNASLTDVERRRRIAAYYEPYHVAIDDLIGRRLAAGRRSALVAVHSFTPVYRGVARPWEVGVIFDRDRRLAAALIDGFQRMHLKVGVNEPYSPADRVYYTLSRHAEARGLAAVMIEIRNDLIRTDPDAATWAERIGSVLVEEEAASATTPALVGTETL